MIICIHAACHVRWKPSISSQFHSLFPIVPPLFTLSDGARGGGGLTDGYRNHSRWECEEPPLWTKWENKRGGFMRVCVCVWRNQWWANNAWCSPTSARRRELKRRRPFGLHPADEKAERLRRRDETPLGALIWGLGAGGGGGGLHSPPPHTHTHTHSMKRVPPPGVPSVDQASWLKKMFSPAPFNTTITTPSPWLCGWPRAIVVRWQAFALWKLLLFIFLFWRW